MPHRLVGAIGAYALTNTVAAALVIDADSHGTALAQAAPLADGDGSFISMKMLLSFIGFLSVSMLGLIGYFLQRTLAGVETSITSVAAQIAHVDTSLTAKLDKQAADIATRFDRQDQKVEKETGAVKAHVDTEIARVTSRLNHVDDVNREARHEWANRMQPVTLKVEVQSARVDELDRRVSRNEQLLSEHSRDLAIVRKTG